MTHPAYLRLPALALAAVTLSSMPATSYGFLGLFEKREKSVPGAAERQQQEAEATALLAEAREAQSRGREGKAESLYASIVKRYPFTTAAAEAAYANAVLVRHNGSLSDAFDAFQKFISDYRSSPRFNDALQQQFELAEEAKGGRRQRSLIIIPLKMGGEDVIKLYETIITNAPFGKLAPLAQVSIAEIYQDLGEKGKAVTAYQKVVDNYPNTKQASEAQFRIGSISNVAASRSEDKSNFTATRDALNIYMATNPKGERLDEAEMILQQVNSEQATQSLQIGKFYQRSGKAKAAAIYYNEALKYGSPEASAEARELLGELAATDPEAVADAKKGQPSQDYTVPGAANLKKRPDYIGPMAPELARLGEKPKMRTGDDNFMPIPVQEPVLPTTPGAMAPSDGALLPPVEERPALLPVPAAPSASSTPDAPATSASPAAPAAPATPGIPPQPTETLPVPPKPAP